MNIMLLKQTKRGNCGQTAVAMLTGKSIKEVERVYGHGHTTFLFEHYKNLPKLGAYVDERGYMEPSKPGFKVPETGFLRLGFLKQSGGNLSTSGKLKKCGHFVAVYKGRIYDPNGMSYPVEALPKSTVITHALEVLLP